MDGADPAGFDVLYLGQDHDTILREVGAVFGPLLNPISNPDAFKSWVVLPITVNLTDVVDLTDPVQAHLLSTNAQELTGDFRHFGIRTPPASGPAPHTGRAPTQELSLELHRLGFKGIINFSAKRPDRRTLAVFHDHLAAPCFIEYRCEVSYGKFQTVRIP